jgi:ABC-type uncharacterized transport system substrate-binding protein
MNGRRRRAVLTAIGLPIAMIGASTPRSAAAQRASARIGYLVSSPLVDPPSAERAAFLDELARLGYALGKNLQIEYRSAENAPEFLPALAAELVAARVDVIVAAGALAADAASAATSRIPIVFTHHPDPVGSGLVKSLARPGGNVTGVTFIAPELVAKRMQLLREVLPRAKRVAAIWDAETSSAAEPELKATTQMASKLGMALDSRAVDSGETLLRIFDQLARTRPDALIVLGDQRMFAYRDIVIEHVDQLRLPTIAGWGDFVRAGGLMSYAPHFPTLFRRSASHVVRILKGADPAGLPVEQPTRFELVINLKAAKALGITIPQSVLVRADEVVR